MHDENQPGHADALAIFVAIAIAAGVFFVFYLAGRHF